MNLNPIEIKGNWDKGFVLDMHVLSSTPKGENVYGHMEYDTVRTPLGELVYQLKYRNKHENIYEILNMIKSFLDNFVELKDVNVVLPVPPSKERDYQPVEELARAIADYLKIGYTSDVLEKRTTQQSKDMAKDAKNIDGNIIKKINAKKAHSILLVDDLYSTGNTITECVSVLKTDPLLNKIYVIVMTKTR